MQDNQHLVQSTHSSSSLVTERKSALSFALILLVTVSVFTTDLYLASFPHLIDYFNSSPLGIQSTLSVYLFGFSISMLICAPLADRFGYRRVILTSLIVYFVASLFCSLSSSLRDLIIGRFFQAFGGCCCSILSRVVVRDHYAETSRIKLFASLFTGMAISVALAPMLGSYLYLYFGWRANFIYMCVYSALLFLVAYKTLPENATISAPDRGFYRDFFRRYQPMLANSKYLCYTLVITFLWAGFFTFVAKAPFLFISIMRLPIETFGFLYSLVISGLIIGTVLANRLAKVWEIHTSIVIGTTISLIAATLLCIITPLFENVLSIALPMTLYLLGTGLVLPNCQAAASQLFGSTASSAFSLMYFLKMAAGAIGGMLVNAANPTSIYPFVGMIFCCALCSFLTLRFDRKQKT